MKKIILFIMVVVITGCAGSAFHEELYSQITRYGYHSNSAEILATRGMPKHIQFEQSLPWPHNDDHDMIFIYIFKKTEPYQPSWEGGYWKNKIYFNKGKFVREEFKQITNPIDMIIP